MSTYTSTSRIEHKVDVTDTIDPLMANPCVTHGQPPRFYCITWGSGKKRQRGATAECVSVDCLCFETLLSDVLNKWNRFNPRGE